MDVHVSMRCLDCPYTVTFYGALFKDVSTLLLCTQLCRLKVKEYTNFVYFVCGCMCVYCIYMYMYVCVHVSVCMCACTCVC